MMASSCLLHILPLLILLSLRWYITILEDFDSIQTYIIVEKSVLASLVLGSGCEKWNSAHSTMLQHFGDLVAGHFREYGRTILAACKHYLEGNMVGSVVPEEEEAEYDGAGASSSSSSAPKQAVMRVDPVGRRTQFSDSLKTLFEDLLMEFNVKGADTRKFLEEKVKKNLPAA